MSRTPDGTRGEGPTALSPRTVVPRLLRAGVLSPADVVDAGVVVQDASRANRVLLVRVLGEERGTAVKALAPGAERLQAELRMHALGSERPALRAALPRLVAAAPSEGWLALELVSPGQTLSSAHRAAIGYPVDLARATGRALGAAHGATRDVAAPPSIHLPWPLWLLEPNGPAAFAWDEAPLRAVLDGIAEPPRYRAALAAARSAWRRECLVHGDFKWDNCLVAAGADGGPPEVRIIDWEIAHVGDPAWDVAGVVQEYLAFAELMTLDVTGSHRRPVPLPAETAAVATALRAFFAAYAAAAGLSPGKPLDELAARSVRLGGARLMQTSLEHASRDGAATPAATTLLRRALAMLEESDAVTAGLRLTDAP